MIRSYSYWAAAAFMVLATVLTSSSAYAGLCPKCTGKMFVMNMGKCAACGAATASGSFSLCPACSTKLGQCQACHAAFLVPYHQGTPAAVAPPAPPGAVTPAAAVTPPAAASATKGTTVVPPIPVPVPIAKPAAKPVPAAPAAPVRK